MQPGCDTRHTAMPRALTTDIRYQAGGTSRQHASIHLWSAGWRCSTWSYRLKARWLRSSRLSSVSCPRLSCRSVAVRCSASSWLHPRPMQQSHTELVGRTLDVMCHDLWRLLKHRRWCDKVPSRYEQPAPGSASSWQAADDCRLQSLNLHRFSRRAQQALPHLQIVA